MAGGSFAKAAAVAARSKRCGENSSMRKSRSMGSVGASRISRSRRLTAAFSSPSSVSSAWAASIRRSATSGRRSFMFVLGLHSYHEVLEEGMPGLRLGVAWIAVAWVLLAAGRPSRAETPRYQEADYHDGHARPRALAFNAADGLLYAALS